MIHLRDIESVIKNYKLYKKFIKLIKIYIFCITDMSKINIEHKSKRFFGERYLVLSIY